MNVIGAIIAGVVGTAVMTILMYVAPMMGMPKMDIIGMLGSMVTTDKRQATGLGLAMHMMMGILFALVYALLWSAGVGGATALWGIVFGAIHTIAVLIVMPMMMRVHPRPPEMDSGPMTMMGQLVGHMVFGLVVALVYATF